MTLATSVPGLVLLFVAAQAAAQQEVRIQGRVIAELDSRPLSYAEVTFRGADGRLLSRLEADSAGWFATVVKGQRGVRIRAERIGYKANTTPFLHFDGRSFFEVEVRLDTDALLLAPLEVIAWDPIDRSPFLANFRARYRSGVAGTFITRRDIERRKPVYVSDMLRSIPGVEFSGGGPGNRPTIQIGRVRTPAGAPPCRTQMYIDGMLLTRGLDWRLDDVVRPADVEGIEVYKGLSTVPAEFFNPDAKCGVIAVWTRRGAGPRGGGS